MQVSPCSVLLIPFYIRTIIVGLLVTDWLSDIGVIEHIFYTVAHSLRYRIHGIIFFQLGVSTADLQRYARYFCVLIFYLSSPFVALVFHNSIRLHILAYRNHNKALRWQRT